jgi:hypothetical protein
MRLVAPQPSASKAVFSEVVDIVVNREFGRNGKALRLLDLGGPVFRGDSSQVLS